MINQRSIGYANHLAMHEREAKLAEKYGWSPRNPFKANQPPRLPLVANDALP